MASSTTGGPIILIPYRDGEGEGRLAVVGGLQGFSKSTHYLYMLLLFKREHTTLHRHNHFDD